MKVRDDILDISYLAGFFDGEGSISERQNGSWPTVRIHVSQIDRLPVFLFQENFGGNVKQRNRKKYNPNARLIWEWTAQAKLAGYALEILLPHLRVKFEEARAALRYSQHLSAGTRGRKLTFSEAIERQEILDIWRTIRLHKRKDSA